MYVVMWECQSYMLNIYDIHRSMVLLILNLIRLVLQPLRCGSLMSALVVLAIHGNQAMPPQGRCCD